MIIITNTQQSVKLYKELNNTNIDKNSREKEKGRERERGGESTIDQSSLLDIINGLHQVIQPKQAPKDNSHNAHKRTRTNKVQCTLYESL